jgi:hypothetical protein
MGYNIEISIDMVKHPNLSEIKRDIIELAFDFLCEYYYYLYEMEGGCKFKRNHCVIMFNFEEENIFLCSKFLKRVRQMKDLHIECIYEDTINCKLIYASRYYLTTMEKDNVIKYTKFKRERGYSDNENMLLEGKTNSLAGNLGSPATPPLTEEFYKN